MAGPSDSGWGQWYYRGGWCKDDTCDPPWSTGDQQPKHGEIQLSNFWGNVHYSLGPEHKLYCCTLQAEAGRHYFTLHTWCGEWAAYYMGLGNPSSTTPLEIYSGTPQGRLQCHHRPWWPNSELSLYLLNYTLERYRVKKGLSEIPPRTPLGRLKHHHKPWWQNFKLTLYLLYHQGSETWAVLLLSQTGLRELAPQSFLRRLSHGHRPVGGLLRRQISWSWHKYFTFPNFWDVQ